MPRVSKPSSKRWKLPGVAYGYIKQRGEFAVMYYKGQKRSTGLLWDIENRQQALEMLRQWIDPDNANSRIIEVDASTRMVSDILPEYRQHVQRWPKRAYRYGAKYALDLYFSTDCQLEERALAQQMVAKEDAYAGKRGTLRPHRAYMSKFFNWCIAAGYLDANPVRRLPRLQVPRKMYIPFSEDEVQAIIAHVDAPYNQQKDRNPRDRNPRDRNPEECRAVALGIEFLYLTATRIEELLLLACEDVHEDRLLIWGKGSAPRVFPLSPPPMRRVAEIVHELRALNHVNTTRTRPPDNERFVFPWRSGAPVRNAFNAACESLGIWRERTVRGVPVTRTLHTLRGSAELRWERAGLPAQVIEDLSGHSHSVRMKHYRGDVEVVDLAKSVVNNWAK